MPNSHARPQSLKAEEQIRAARPKRFSMPFLAGLIALMLALVVSSCGTSSEEVVDAVDSATDAEAAGPESEDQAEEQADAELAADVDDAMASDELPSRIVSLSPTATEMLFAIGAGDQVAGVDLYSNYPAEAPEGTLDAFAPDLEAIVAVEPDLVISAGLPEEITAGLDDLGIAHLTQPAAADLDGVYDQIGELGVLTGQVDGAAEANAQIRAGVDAVLASLPASETPLKVFHEIDDSFYTATSATFIGQVYSSMGFENIADPADDGSGYPLIDGEAIIAANPDIIIYTNQATYTATDIAARPGWDAISAVANDRIVEVDADVSSRWGPRIVEFMETIAANVSE